MSFEVDNGWTFERMATKACYISVLFPQHIFLKFLQTTLQILRNDPIYPYSQPSFGPFMTNLGEEKLNLKSFLFSILSLIMTQTALFLNLRIQAMVVSMVLKFILSDFWNRIMQWLLSKKKHAMLELGESPRWIRISIKTTKAQSSKQPEMIWYLSWINLNE